MINLLTHAAKGSALTALCLFALIDATVKSIGGLKTLDQFDPVTKSEAAQVIKSYQSSSSKPDIVFLGSSVVREALRNAPRDFLKDSDNPSNNGVYQSLASSGQFVSDAYFLTTKIIARKKPHLIIYGIAPRDFMDNQLTSWDTDVFHYLARTKEISAPRNYFSSWIDALDCLLTRSSYMYDHKIAFCQLSNSIFERPIRNAQLALDCRDNREKVTHEQELNEQIYQYWRSYQPFNNTIYQRQLGFFKMLLTYCSKEHLPIVIVKMPTKPLEVAMRPEQLRLPYDQDIQTISSQSNDPVFDIASSESFTASDFADLVHLNAKGGTTFRIILRSELAAKNKKGSAQLSQI